MEEQSLEELKQDCILFFKDNFKEENRVIVFGEGNEKARLILVGEAPGEQEVIQKRPFVGPAGRNLDEFLEILDISRENLYVTNVVKFRPFKAHPVTKRLSNRPPSREEIDLCISWLYKELMLIQPIIVITLGNYALRAISGNEKATIGQFHGKPVPITLPDHKFSCILFPLYHPASIIYKRELKETYLHDLAILQVYLKEQGIYD